MLDKFWKKVLINAVLSAIRISADLIDINDASEKLSGLKMFDTNKTEILLFILIVAICDIIVELIKAGKNKTKVDCDSE